MAKTYSINSIRINEYRSIYTVELFDQNGRSVKRETFDKFEETHTAHELAVQMLADYMRIKAAGFVKITGPGISKVLYQRQGDFEPIEEELDQVYDVGWD